MKKRLFAAVLAVLMVLSVVPVTAVAEGPTPLGQVGYAADKDTAQTAITASGWTLSEEEKNMIFAEGNNTKENWVWAGVPHCADQANGTQYRLTLTKEEGQEDVGSLSFSSGETRKDDYYIFLAGGDTHPPIIVFWWETPLPASTVTAKLYSGEELLGETTVNGNQQDPGPDNPGDITLQAGFEWLARSANDSVNEGMGGGTVGSCGDQTVWMTLTLPAGGDVIEYFYTVHDTANVTGQPLMAGRFHVRPGSEYVDHHIGYANPSFVRMEDNNKTATLPSSLTVSVYRVGLPNGEGQESSPPDWNDNNKIYTQTITTGRSPFAITNASPWGEYGKLGMDLSLNYALKGFYYAEITKGSDVIGGIPISAWDDGGVQDLNFAIEQRVYPGNYTISIYPGINNDTGNQPGKLPNSAPVATRNFTLEEYINSMEVVIGTVMPDTYDNRVVSTALIATANNTDKTVSLSGNYIADGNELVLTLFGYDRAGNWIGDSRIKLVKENGSYTLAKQPAGDNPDYLDKFATWLSHENGYKIDISGITCIDAKVETAEPEVNTNSNAAVGSTTAADVQAVENALTGGGNGTGVTITEETKDALVDDASKVVGTVPPAALERAEEQVKQLPGVSQDSTVRIVVQTSLDVQIKKVDYSATTKKSITIDITPKIQVVATTARENSSDKIEIGTNAVAVSGYANKQTLNVSQTVEISIPLPSGFASNSTPAYVRHKGHVYNGTILSGALKFLNPHGFSEFEVSLENPIVAKVDSDNYDNIEDAILAASGKTVKIVGAVPTGNISISSTVRNVKIVDASGNALTNGLTINGTKYTGAELKEGIDIVVSTVTPPTVIPGGNGGSSSTSSGVTAAPVENGAVTLSTNSAKPGEKVTVTVATKAPYYVVTKVTAKGDSTVTASKNADGTYSFLMPTGSSVTVSAEIRHIYDLFTDVPTAFAEYGEAIKWAVEQGVTLGNSADYSTFGSESSCTREQMVVFLYRAAGSPAVDSSVSRFTDLPSDEEIQKAVQWAVDKGITQGAGGTKFDPYAPCSRSQMVTFLHRSHSKPTVACSNPFTDVPVGEYYTDAVQWAVSTGITKGTSDTTFGPDNACTRVQMVTFLYRDMTK